MGADYILDRSCEPKLFLGGGDVMAGTTRMLAMLKAKSRAEAIGHMMAQSGQDPATASVTVVVMGPDGPQERAVTVAEMSSQAAPLQALAPHCSSCSACAMAATFGCFGYMNYPLTETVERWIVARMQSADTLGGFLLLKAIEDFGYDGRAMNSWRQREDLMSLPNALAATVGNQRVSTDQLLQAILHVGSELGPAHSVGVLLWLGGLKFDGQVPGPGTSGDPSALIAISSATTEPQRRAILEFDIGPPDHDDSVRGFQQLLYAMYASWVLDVPLLMDA